MMKRFLGETKMHSFRTRLLLSLLPTLAGLILLEAAVSVYIIRQQTYGALNERMFALGENKNIQHLLAASLQTLTLHNIENFSDNALLMPDIAYFAIYDKNNKLVYQDGNTKHGNSNNIRHEFPLLYYPYALNMPPTTSEHSLPPPVKLGKFIVEFHTELVAQRVADTLKGHLLLSGFLLLAIIIGVIKAFRTSIGKPLEHLSNAIRFTQHTGIKKQVEWKTRDEVGMLVEAYNRLLDEQEQLLNEAQRLANIGSWNLNLETSELVWSDQMYRICGLDPHDFKPTVENSIAFIHPDDRSHIEFAIRRVIIANVPFDEDIRITGYDDTERIVHVQIRAFRDQTGKTELLVGSVLDITEKKQTEEALYRSEARCRSLFEQAPDAMFIADKNNDRIIGANPAASKLLGYNHNELLQKTVTETRVIKHAGKSSSTILNDLDHEGAFDGIALRRDGHQIPVEIITKQLEDSNGQLTLSTVRDITDRERVDRELRHAQQMEALGNLAGGLAHSLNNLLVPILLSSQMVEKSLPKNTVDGERMARVILAATHAKDLVARVLTFSRRQEPQRENLNIVSLVQESLGLLQTTLPSTVTIEVDLDQDVEPIYADPTQIETVLLDMTSNAAAAMQGKPGILTISLSQETVDSTSVSMRNFTDGSYIKLTFSDTGKGIDEESKTRIFEPFYTTKEAGQGTGLGLSSVYGIVSQHGGFIEVNSQSGAGTTFDVYLPCTTTDAP